MTIADLSGYIALSQDNTVSNSSSPNRYTKRVNLQVTGYDEEVTSILSALADLDDLPYQDVSLPIYPVDTNVTLVDFRRAKRGLRRGQ